jgi:elongator complex protein 3
MLDPIDRTLFGLLRLRIPSQVFSGEKHFIDVLQNAAIVREVHVFGDQIPVGMKENNSGQHMGFGKKMLEAAEEKIRSLYPQCTKIAVIAGVGSRPYYEKRGYKLQDEYMIKHLDS